MQPSPETKRSQVKARVEDVKVMEKSTLVSFVTESKEEWDGTMRIEAG